MLRSATVGAGKVARVARARGRTVVAAAVLALVGSACESDSPSESPLPVPSLTLAPSLPGPRCDPQPALPPTVRGAIEEEIRKPFFQNAAGVGRAAELGRVRAVRQIVPPRADAPAVTAVVFDVRDGGKTATFGQAVRTSGNSASIDAWDGLVPTLEDIDNGVVRVRVGRALHTEYVFLYGIVASPAVTSAKNVVVTSSGRVEEFSGPVCDGIFALGGWWNGPAEAWTTNRLELVPAVGSTVLSAELDPGPIE